MKKSNCPACNGKEIEIKENKATCIKCGFKAESNNPDIIIETWNNKVKFIKSLKKASQEDLLKLVHELAETSIDFNPKTVKKAKKENTAKTVAIEEKEPSPIINTVKTVAKTSELKEITIYTDGACTGNPGPGGWGTIMVYKEIVKEFSGGEKRTTNNRMELTAVIEGLSILKEPCKVHIISDSQYVLNGLSKWIFNWIKKDFKDVKNDDLWRRFVEVSKKHKITTEWVKGHNGHHYNERCDRLATTQAKLFK
jgi:ribonuclease HI